MTLLVEMTHRFPDREFPGLAMDLQFQAPAAAVTAVFGPSGAGKSTLIAAIAGLLQPHSCRIVLDDIVLADSRTGIWTPAEVRRIGLVFQDARLFPHMSVTNNLRYGQRRAPSGPPARAIGFADVVDLLGIGRLLDRRPQGLSGGERQRVAIGRALLAQPRLLLLDEPLASLDSARKAEILPYLAGIRDSLKLPMVYVTHSLDEVARLADWLVLLDAGRVSASGPLDALTARGDLAFAQRDDAGSILTVTVDQHDPGRRLSVLRAGATRLIVPLIQTPPGTTVRVRIPAREVALARQAPQEISIHNIVPGTVRAISQDAPRHAALVEIALDRGAILARITPDAVQRLALAPGQPVLALVKSVAIEVLAP